MSCSNLIRLGQNYVPCGKCAMCRLRARSDWIVRIREEMKYTQGETLFITLTYSDEHLPRDGLCVRDIQLFLKKLRKYGKKFRYYIVGEYGTTTHRAHYHGLLFGISISEEPCICQAWSKGFITIAPVSEARIKYITTYTLAKSVVPDGCNPPTLLVSRNPGLGAQMLTDNKKHYYRASPTHEYRDMYNKSAMPRYYRDKIYDSEMKEVLRENFNKIQNEKYKHLERMSPEELARYCHNIGQILDFSYSKAQKLLTKKTRVL